MHKIYKYTLKVVDAQLIRLPHDAKILSVTTQMESVVLYALVDPDAVHDDDVYAIYIHGTGHVVPEDEMSAMFLGTVILMNGVLMFHVFCKKI